MTESEPVTAIATIGPSAGERTAAAAGEGATPAPDAPAGADAVAVPDVDIAPGGAASEGAASPDGAVAATSSLSPTFDAESSLGPAPEARSPATPDVVGREPPALAEVPSAAPIDVARASSSALPADTLDFASLVARLRKTKAINLVTKVAVKNQSNDLLEEFRAYHTQHGTATLAELRRSYDSLFSRLHMLLQDADPPLARDVDRSRAAIWEILSDPRKFTASRLMSGA